MMQIIIIKLMQETNRNDRNTLRNFHFHMTITVGSMTQILVNSIFIKQGTHYKQHMTASLAISELCFLAVVQLSD